MDNQEREERNGSGSYGEVGSRQLKDTVTPGRRIRLVGRAGYPCRQVRPRPVGSTGACVVLAIRVKFSGGGQTWGIGFFLFFFS